MAMYGADVEQLRALARTIDTAATRLDQDRLTVGNAIRVQAWVGPVAVRFRAEWDSSHSAKVAGAAARLREAARTLRRSADEQEHASMPGAGRGSLGLSSYDPARLLGVAAGIGSVALAEGGAVKNLWGAVSSTVSSADLFTGIGEKVSQAAHTLLLGKGAETWRNLEKVGESTKFGHLLGIAGKTVGALSIGVGAVETVMAARDGDIGGAVWSGAKTVISVASMIPPVAPFAAALSIGIGVGEILSRNPAITKFAGDLLGPPVDVIAAGINALPTVATGVTAAVSGAGAAAGRFLGGVASAAKKLWPW